MGKLASRTRRRKSKKVDEERQVRTEFVRSEARPDGRVVTIERVLHDPEIERLKKLEAAGKLKTVPMDEDFAAEYNARRIKWRAEDLGLTQREIARRVGVSPVVINRIFKNPDRSTVATLRKIAKAMGVKLVELLDD